MAAISTLRSFPCLGDDDFHQACSDLIQRFQDHGSRQKAWLSVEMVSDRQIDYLRVTKELHNNGEVQECEDEVEVEICEDGEDEEVLHVTAKPKPVLCYDVILSQTYRVPVLYFSISDPQHRFPVNLETLYDHVIPPRFKAQAENVGVIGGITIHEHPATGRPVFYIHPCRTAELMQASAGDRNITASEYLYLWIGSLGKSVGLDIPLALAHPHHDEYGQQAG